MKVLKSVTPTAEQLKLIQDHRPGVAVIRGAAGSGKTTTALLRLKFLVGFWIRRNARLGIAEPVRVLVLTYNRTLRGYVSELVRQQVPAGSNAEIEISTFGKWAKDRIFGSSVIDEDFRRNELLRLGSGLGLDSDLLVDEVDYILGRFLPAGINEYLSTRREGRGRAPRVDRGLRARILAEVVNPYVQWKTRLNGFDWNDFAVALAEQEPSPEYDIAIVDEAQDFSANQVRAVTNFLAEDHSVTFLLDAAQRIYPRFFSWSEVGIAVQSGNNQKLNNNYRNTKQIAAFARQVVEGVDVGDDGALPEFSECEREGDLPIVLSGGFAGQVKYCIDLIRRSIDLQGESVVFLHAKGGRWFDYLREQLRRARLHFVELARADDWPEGPENIALSTMHSVKGLEFDHVFILGLNAETTPHGEEVGDSQLENLRRLLAMAVGRAKKSLVVGFKPTEASSLVEYFNVDTYVGVDV
ncbi:3'-5' exonuclease [Corallococcus sp. RDP092CA]